MCCLFLRVVYILRVVYFCVIPKNTEPAPCRVQVGRTQVGFLLDHQGSGMGLKASRRYTIFCAVPPGRLCHLGVSRPPGCTEFQIYA